MNLKEAKQKSKEEATRILIEENKERFKELYKFRLSINKLGTPTIQKR